MAVMISSVQHISNLTNARRPAPLRLLALGQSHIQMLRLAVFQSPDYLSSCAGRPVEINLLYLPPARTGAWLTTGHASDGLLPFVENWMEEHERFRDGTTRLFDAVDHVVVLWQGGQMSIFTTIA